MLCRFLLGNQSFTTYVKLLFSLFHGVSLFWFLTKVLFHLGCTMAFLTKLGNMLRQTANRQITSEISASRPSIYQAIRCMSSSKIFIGGASFLLLFFSLLVLVTCCLMAGAETYHISLQVFLSRQMTTV